MLANASRASRAATCEEWDEDAQTTLPDTRTSANVAAKRSKPELAPTKPHRRRTVEGDGDKMGRTATSTKDDSSIRKMKKAVGLKLDTSFSERESRPYSSGPPVERLPRNTSRPTTKRSVSKVETPTPSTRHQQGECWICDYYGQHIVVPADLQGPLKGLSIPQSSLTASQQPSHQAQKTTKRPESTGIQPRKSRSQSQRGKRPTSFHAGMLPEAYDQHSSQPFPTTEWKMPPTQITPYTNTPFAQMSIMAYDNRYQDYQQSFPMQNDMQAPLARPRPPEPHRGTSARGEPIIEQIPVLMDQPPLTRTTSLKDHQRSRNSSVSREEDARKMPPPETIPAARRPSMFKANTSTTNPVMYHRERRYSNQGPVPAQSPHKERRPDLPPSSYREPPSSAYQTSSHDRPVPRKSTSHQDTKHMVNIIGSGSGLDKRTSMHNAERHVPEAEAYQRSRGTQLHPLTIDAVSKISRHSDSGSQRSINTSSRGSSGGKTKTTGASTDITMTINGVTLGISGDSAENHSIKIQPKRNGGLNISVGEHDSSSKNDEATSLPKRSGSTTSSSKHSRRSSEKEARRPKEESLDRCSDRATKVSSWPSKPSVDESCGYGISYG